MRAGIGRCLREGVAAGAKQVGGCPREGLSATICKLA